MHVQGGATMKDRLEHPAIKWFLIFTAFIVSFHAAWTALEYINRAPKPIPILDYEIENPELPSQGPPGVLIKDRSWRSPQKGMSLWS
jgi:hypothetical protein